MLPSKSLPSSSSFFSAYASMAGSVMLIRSIARDILPPRLRKYMISKLHTMFKASDDSKLTLVISEADERTPNQIYQAAEAYLATKLDANTRCLRVSKNPKAKALRIQLETDETVVDFYGGVKLRWKSCSEVPKKNKRGSPFRGIEQRYFEVKFEAQYKDFVLGSYLPHVLETAQKIEGDRRVIKMFTQVGTQSLRGPMKWASVKLEHPSTFETVAMDPDMRKRLIEDLNRFVERREFYRRVGKSWKRGYLLFGPPGTGKSSLVAAIANHLKFDIYDLQLSNLMTDWDLRRLLLSIHNRSLLVVEDVDCSAVDFSTRKSEVQEGDGKKPCLQPTLSGLLNFIDGLWSSCGDERIIIFTTNHKESLDPALLRPGRMDMHIYMSYCTFQTFKELASNYLNLPPDGHHQLYGEIEGLIRNLSITPACIAEELMKTEDPDEALGRVVNLLKRKRTEGELEENAASISGKTEGKKQRKFNVRS